MSNNRIIAIRVTDQMSEENGGVVIYVVYSDGRMIRNTVAPDMVEAYGVPVIG